MTYESTFICSPETPAEKLEELVEKAKKIIESNEGKLTLLQQLGRKKLAYPIAKFREGSYVYMEIAGPGKIVNALETLYKVNEAVIRSLTVKVEKKKPAKAAPAADAAPKEIKPEETAPAQTIPQEVKPEEVKADASTESAAS
jgi:small subunit ribosomal protein S6